MESEFDKLLELSTKSLQTKNEANAQWGLGSFDRWDLEQEKGVLVFSNDDGTQSSAQAQIIGTYNTTDSTWLWAWDNPSIAEHLKRTAQNVRQYGESAGIQKLTTRKWTATEDQAWQMAALAVHMSDAEGAYRGPAGSAYVFITFGKVTHRQAAGDDED